MIGCFFFLVGDDWLLFEVLLSNSFSHNLDSVYEIYGFC